MPQAGFEPTILETLVQILETLTIQTTVLFRSVFFDETALREIS